MSRKMLNFIDFSQFSAHFQTQMSIKPPLFKIFKKYSSGNVPSKNTSVNFEWTFSTVESSQIMFSAEKVLQNTVFRRLRRAKPSF
jgi:hypothetical protein